MIVFYQHRTIIGRASVHDGTVTVEGLPWWLSGHAVKLDGRILTIADGPDWLIGLARTLRSPYLRAVVERDSQSEGSIQS